MYTSLVGYLKRSIYRFENNDLERVFSPIIRVLLLYENLFHPKDLVSGNIILR